MLNDNTVRKARCRVIQPQIDKREDIRWLDAYSMRDLFLRIRTPEEALDFLTVTGYFRWSEKGDSDIHLSVKWSDLKLWQDLIRLRMTKRDLDSWLIRDDSGKVVGRDWNVSPHFEPIVKHLTDQECSRLEGWSDQYQISPRPSKSNRRQMELVARTEECDSTLEAMLAVVNIDHLKGIPYRLCRLSGCNNVFEVTRPDKVARSPCLRTQSARL